MLVSQHTGSHHPLGQALTENNGPSLTFHVALALKAHALGTRMAVAVCG